MDIEISFGTWEPQGGVDNFEELATIFELNYAVKQIWFTKKIEDKKHCRTTCPEKDMGEHSYVRLPVRYVIKIWSK